MSAGALAIARVLLREEEGRRNQPYYDSLGYVTVGIGRLCDPRKPCPFPDGVIDDLFEADLAEKCAQARLIPGFEKLNFYQQAVLISMVFQLGFEPFDGDGFKDFKKFLAALRTGDLRTAAVEGLDSKWAREDTPRRAQRQMKMLETGVWVPR